MHSGVRDGYEALHAAVEVTWHQVCRSDIDDRLIRWQAVTVTETVDAAMLKEASDDGLNPDILGKLRNLRAQAADAAHHQINLHAGAARHVERIDDFRIDQRIHLHPDLRGTPF